MSFSASIPIYLQVVDRLKRDIVSGRRAPGERLESVRALAEGYGINLNTVQRACAQLEREGVIVTRRGVGSFVTEDRALLATIAEMADEVAARFRAEMEALGFTWEEAQARLRGGNA